jgi:ribosomal protein S18 acetylase RimI-like enzyme
LNCEIREEGTSILPEYGQIPIAFDVLSVFDVHLADQGLSGMVLSERRLSNPYVKDYDGCKDRGPVHWAKRFDVSNWAVLSAFQGVERVGGCVIARDTEGILKLEGHKDIAALWDLRVHPAFRRGGVGSALFNRAVAWTREQGGRCLAVETQNINVPACRFYAKQGCMLGAINRFAYVEFPDEVELVWYRDPEPDGSNAPSA